jgi:rubrerythrin
MPVTLTPTKDTGATTQPSRYVYVEPGLDSTERPTHDPMPDSGLNGPFIADLLSAALTHERCGVHLYRSVAARSANPILKGRYEDFERDTLHHVEVLEGVIAAMGGDPQYVSPMARAVEGMNTHLLESTYTLNGSIDVMAQEMVLLDAVLLAETIDHANWSNLQRLVDELPEGPARSALAEAVAEIEDDEDQHLGWAKDTKSRLTIMMAKGPKMTKVASTVEELTARVKSWLS